MLVAAEEKVRRLHVAVHDALAVGRVEGVCSLLEPFERLPPRPGSHRGQEINRPRRNSSASLDSRSAGSVELKMLRRSILLIFSAATIAAGLATAANGASVCTGTCFTAPAGSGALFVFSGHGWGHGVGM